MKKHDIKILNYNDEKYPENLKNVSTPPTKLYYMGNVDLLNKKRKIAIIGCREYSEYGKIVSEKFAYELAKLGFVIISGAARGIDSFSHKATLKTNVGTIAVVGNGLNYIYPPENKELEEKILENNGLIISEYDIGTRPSKYTFPARNRIISALSDGVLVIEARKNSGLTQQQLADMLEMDRSSVSKYENGIGLPLANTLQKICEILGVTMDSLFK